MSRRPAAATAALSDKALRAAVLEGVSTGTPVVGPLQVHIDITNGCNAACVTCWDHSPLLKVPRPAAWKRRRMPLERFARILDQLDAFGSVRAIVVSGMGEPLTHPDVYEMLRLVKRRGWHLTVLSNLLAADIDRLCESGVDQLLVGVQGATPDTYAAFHPGWNERHFFTMCRYLRRLSRAGVTARHVQVINRDTAEELVDMVRFGGTFGADRVNFKLASLYGGTEDCGITAAQRDRLLRADIPEARALAQDLAVHTNLDLFEGQVRAAMGDLRATVPISDIGCFMGFAYTRITVDEEVLYCCNTEVRVGDLQAHDLGALWWGPAWQALRDQLRAGRYLRGCDKCGKFEQNRKWSARVRGKLGEAAWAEATGR